MTCTPLWQFYTSSSGFSDPSRSLQSLGFSSINRERWHLSSTPLKDLLPSPLSLLFTPSFSFFPTCFVVVRHLTASSPAPEPAARVTLLPGTHRWWSRPFVRFPVFYVN